MSSTRHTIDLIKRHLKKLPPLLPEALLGDVRGLIEELESKIDATTEDIERLVVKKTASLWPYRASYQAMLGATESHLGELQLYRLMSPGLRATYDEFVACGGSYQDIVEGHTQLFFSADEARELSALVHRVQQHIHDYTRQQIHAFDREKYLQMVSVYEQKLALIQQKINRIKSLLQEHDIHERYATRAKHQIESFEYGLSGLGPFVGFDVIDGLHDDLFGNHAV
jgi:uncharacterized small protein (DUF1192 family)